MTVERKVDFKVLLLKTTKVTKPTSFYKCILYYNALQIQKYKKMQ